MNALRAIARRLTRKPTAWCDLCTTNAGKHYRDGHLYCSECLRWVDERKV